MTFTVDRMPPAHVIRLTGRWDAFSAREFGEFWEPWAKKEKPRLLVLDLSGVDYISSYGLRDLLEVGRALEAAGGGLHVAGLCPLVRKVFQGGGLAGLFPAFDTVAAAVAAFAKKA